jgi:hypothetical protein
MCWAAAQLQLQLSAAWWEALRGAALAQLSQLSPRDIAQVGRGGEGVLGGGPEATGAALCALATALCVQRFIWLCTWG